MKDETIDAVHNEQISTQINSNEIKDIYNEIDEFDSV